MKRRNSHKYLKLSFLLVTNLLGFFISKGQQIDSDSFLKEVKISATKFFVDRGLLDSSVLKSDDTYVYIVEMKEKKILGYNLYGIYRIGVLQSNTVEYILIKENLKYKIFEINDIENLLKAVIDFSIRNKLPRNTLFFYLKKIIGMFNDK